mmetsp:Transcript_7427/g.16362  ORF Transcript_7427/g.16362 Transcript_7427/m.16362 type:complete len:103 (-) Transcript_7427:119-427(-)
MGCASSTGPSFKKVDGPPAHVTRKLASQASVSMHIGGRPPAPPSVGPPSRPARGAFPKMVVVQCPSYAAAGTKIEVVAPDGQVVNFVVPPGLHPGQTLSVQY